MDASCDDHLQWEAAYWGDCANTYDEEQKHWVYARLMGLQQQHWSLVHPGGEVLDIGGGPVSMLLKCPNPEGRLLGTVVDPLSYPAWTRARYGIHGIEVLQLRGEDLDALAPDCYAEAWIYNCLQHTDDPQRIIRHALRLAPVLRIAEWIDIPPHDGHPQMLTAAVLEQWTGARGRSTRLAESGCYGLMWSAVIQRPPLAAAAAAGFAETSPCGSR